MAVNWNALMNMPNAGQSFMHAFQGARQMKQQEEDRRIQMQERQEDRQLRRDTLEAQQQKALLEQHRDKILMGAKIVRQFNPQDEASWQAARNAAAMAGIDLSDVPPNYNPQYVQGLISIADAMEKDTQAPSDVREYEYARSQGFQGSYMDFKNAFGPPIMVDNGDGTKTLYPRSAMGGGMPQQQGGTPPPPPPGFVLDSDGGPAASPPATFQPGIGPR